MLGTRIAALRREAGLSQAELAQRLQVSPSALGMYEQERREPSMQTLVKLSRELGVTTDYLLTGTPAEKEREELEEMLDPRAFIGCCPSQVTRFLKDTVQPVVDRWGAKETLTAKLEV